MGCTSSTPSHVSSSSQHANATENLEILGKGIEDNIQTETIANNNSNSQKDSESSDPVLPESDIIVEELLDIDSNNTIKTNTGNIMGNEVPEIVNGHKIDEHAVIEVLMSEKIEAEERRQRDLEFLNELAKLTEEFKEEESKDGNEKNCTVDKSKQHNESNNEDSVLIDLQDKENMQVEDDVRSESSRTTRWEALADVVAELPPSLAIDHATGQIYTMK